MTSNIDAGDSVSGLLQWNRPVDDRITRDYRGDDGPLDATAMGPADGRPDTSVVSWIFPTGLNSPQWSRPMGNRLTRPAPAIKSVAPLLQWSRQVNGRVT
jgi:hypothetical protein